MSSRFIYIINSRQGKCSFVITNRANLDSLLAALTETNSRVVNIKYVNRAPVVVEIFLDKLVAYDALSIEKQLELDDTLYELFN